MLTNTRKARLRDTLNPGNPEERDYLSVWIGLALPDCPGREQARKLVDDNDYEGAILAQQEASGMYD